MTRIVILGSGFAALTAIRQLRKLRVDAEIIVVSPRNELVYLPSLIWLPSGERSGDDLRVPLADFFRRERVVWHPGSVLQVLEGGRRVVTDKGELHNDYLIVATGGRYLRKLPGIEHALIPCEGIASAEAIRDRLAAMDGGTIAIGFASNPKEPGAVRGGPMFEFLFGIDEQLKREGRRDRFEIVFFNPSTEPGNRLGPRAVKHLLDELARNRIGLEPTNRAPLIDRIPEIAGRRRPHRTPLVGVRLRTSARGLLGDAFGSCGAGILSLHAGVTISSAA